MMDKLANDIMVPLQQYPCIPETLTLRGAIMEMAVQIVKEDQSSLPRVALVFDDGFSDLRGMLRRRDIMRGLEPRFMVSGSLEYQRKLFDPAVDPNLSELSHEHMVAGIRERAERLVGQYMTPIRATIRHDDHIMKAIQEMVDQDCSLLPVVKDDDVIGVLRSVDVLTEIALLISS